MLLTRLESARASAHQRERSTIRLFDRLLPRAMAAVDSHAAFGKRMETLGLSNEVWEAMAA